MNDGFFRVAAVAPEVKIASVKDNCKAICSAIDLLFSHGVELAVFPELCVTGYTCGDLFHSAVLLNASDDALHTIARHTKGLRMAVIVGAPVRMGDSLYNCAVVCAQGEIKAVIPKTYLPNYNEFYEKRWFASGASLPQGLEVFGAPFNSRLLIQIDDALVACEICEDLWSPIPPSSVAALNGATVIANLSASNDLIGKYSYLKNLIAQQSGRCLAGYVYASAGFGESSTDLVFDGKGIVAESGTIMADTLRWTEGTKMVSFDLDIDLLQRERMHNQTFADSCAAHRGDFRIIPLFNNEPMPEQRTYRRMLRTIAPLPFVPGSSAERDERCSEIFNIQVAGLAQRLQATGCTKVVIGISGGLDSTLALLVAVKAFDRLKLSRKGVIGITMPGFGTTDRTHNNAVALMRGLGVTMKEIPIAQAVMQHFHDIGQDPEKHDVTYENSQARERTQILMDVANKEGAMVIGTGDLSELALGWATYNGDHMSMYGVNASVPKTLVRYLVEWVAQRPDLKGVVSEALSDIAATPISPELIPADENGNIAQITEDIVGPYPLHDFFLYYTLRYGFSPRRIFALATEAFNRENSGDLRYDTDTIKKWMKIFYRRFFNQQFKRSCMPDGPKVGSVCLSPRGDWRMPSDASAALWLAEVESL